MNCPFHPASNLGNVGFTLRGAMRKKAGNGFLSEMEAQFAGWREPGERLREALDKDELTLYCQPIASLAGEDGFPLAEALVRLREEEEAMLPPGDFLPVYEHYGLMPQLDRWVVRNVVQHISRGSSVPRFAVNVSGQSLADLAFPKSVALELLSAGVSGTALLFEIEEADSLARLELAEKFARAIKTIGCGLMLDGFGRRSVSFSALKALKVEFVKVDQSIVHRLLTSTKAEAKLRAIVKVGEVMGYKVIAEMVEDQDVLLRLKELGVGYAQGFGICEPHPIGKTASQPAQPS
jgi:EAL domain-containing protein (putative c-di-GMP-specific phosphodiesterase class I)